MKRTIVESPIFYIVTACLCWAILMPLFAGDAFNGPSLGGLLIAYGIVTFLSGTFAALASRTDESKRVLVWLGWTGLSGLCLFCIAIVEILAYCSKWSCPVV